MEEIFYAIEESKPDLVLITTHGRKGLKHLLLGSVAERMVRLSSVSVLDDRLESQREKGSRRMPGWVRCL